MLAEVLEEEEVQEEEKVREYEEEVVLLLLPVPVPAGLFIQAGDDTDTGNELAIRRL